MVSLRRRYEPSGVTPGAGTRPTCSNSADAWVRPTVSVTPPKVCEGYSSDITHDATRLSEHVTLFAYDLTNRR